MSSTNTSINLNAQTLRQELCPYMGKTLWGPHCLTQTVYYNTAAAILVNAAACPAVVVCNLLVIFCVLKEPRLRRKKSNILLSLLAVTDLVEGVLVYPVFIASLTCRIRGQCNSCLLDTAAYLLLVICCLSSLFHLVLIALDRFIAIRLALRYKALVTTQKTIAGSVVAWTMAFAMSLSPIYGTSVTDYLFLLFGGIPVLVICWCYASVYLDSRKHNKHIQAQIPLGQQSHPRSRHQEFKAAKTTFIVYASTALIFFIPPAIAVCIKIVLIDTSVAETSKISFHFSRQAWICTVIMLNSLSNPLIYSYRTQGMRKAIKRVLNRLRNCACLNAKE